MTSTLALFPIRRYRVLRVVDDGHSNTLFTLFVDTPFAPGELVGVPGVGSTSGAEGGAARGALK